MFTKIKYNKLTDDALIRLIANDDHAAFEFIYNRFWQKLFTLAVYKTGDRQDAEEIIQDVFISIWGRRHELRIEYLEAYLTKAVNLKLIDRLRKKIKAHTKVDIESISLPTEIIDYLTVEDFTAQIEASLNILSAKTKEVYCLSRNEGKSQKEIALHLGVTEKAVEYHITKALKQLKQDLENYLK